jgi:acid phosphatase
MALYGTHDTTIAAILATLGVFDNRWPHFTSNITFELFKAQRGPLVSFLQPGWLVGSAGDEFFVRMKYNQRVVALPGMTFCVFCALGFDGCLSREIVFKSCVLVILVIRWDVCAFANASL